MVTGLMFHPFREAPWVVFVSVTLFLLTAAEIAYHVGSASRRKHGDVKLSGHAGGIQGAVLGLLGLLLGFSFAMAIGRHETRRQLVIEEANSIGTTWLRADLLPEIQRGEAKTLLRRYAETRLEAHETLKRDGDPAGILREISDLHTRLWANAVAACRQAPSPLLAPYLTTLNQTIELHASRIAALRNHVPLAVWFLLSVVACCGAWISGYGSGLLGKRFLFDLYVFPILIGVVMATIADIDQPRQGIISVSQEPLLQQLSSMKP